MRSGAAENEAEQSKAEGKGKLWVLVVLCMLSYIGRSHAHARQRRGPWQLGKTPRARDLDHYRTGPPAPRLTSCALGRKLLGVLSNRKIGILRAAHVYRRCPKQPRSAVGVARPALDVDQLDLLLLVTILIL